jgi:large subunit ribosomal protein L18
MDRKVNKKIDRRKRRHKRVVTRIKSVKRIPRLFVYRSNKHIYAQIIDDKKNITLVEANDKDKEIKKGTLNTKVEIASHVGELIAKRSMEKKINKVAFDRGGFLYKGRIKAVAEGARKGGLKI